MIGNSYMRLVSSMNGGLIIPTFTNTKSVSFDGVDEYLQLNVISELIGVTNASVTCWVKDIDNKVGNAMFWEQRYAANYVFTFRYDGADSKLKIQLRNGVISDYTSGVVSVSGWHKFDIVLDCSLASASRVKLYLDGVDTALVYTGTAPSTTQPNSSNFRVGRNSGGNYLNGKIDEFAIFDYSLSASEVTAQYNSGCPNEFSSSETPRTFLPC